MEDFNAKHVSLGSEETNHYGTKLMDILNYCNLFVVQNNNHTRYASFRDKMDTIIISPSLILIYLVLTLNLTYLQLTLQ